jgi:heterodisulfide reductase subunit A
MKLRPVDFSTDGIFVCGMAHYPKPIEEAITQAQAAAIRAMGVLSKEALAIEPIVAAFIDRDACRGCGLCVALCPYKALDIEETDEGRKVKLITAACKGCGHYDQFIQRRSICQSDWGTFCGLRVWPVSPLGR